MYWPYLDPSTCSDSLCFVQQKQEEPTVRKPFRHSSIIIAFIIIEELAMCITSLCFPFFLQHFDPGLKESRMAFSASALIVTVIIYSCTFCGVFIQRHSAPNDFRYSSYKFCYTNVCLNAERRSYPSAYKPVNRLNHVHKVVVKVCSPVVMCFLLPPWPETVQNRHSFHEINKKWTLTTYWYIWLIYSAFSQHWDHSL